jgi:hypothetical protein
LAVQLKRQRLGFSTLERGAKVMLLNRYWFLLQQDRGNAPHALYQTFASAEEAAILKAKAHPGKVVFLLEAVGAHVCWRTPERAPEAERLVLSRRYCPELDEFWMVHRADGFGHPPRVAHTTADSADKEAWRLACRHVGVAFTVLRSSQVIVANRIGNSQNSAIACRNLPDGTTKLFVECKIVHAV